MSVIGAAAGQSLYEEDWAPNARQLEQYNQMMPTKLTPFQQQQ
jgi:hypothetical protein